MNSTNNYNPGKSTSFNINKIEYVSQYLNSFNDIIIYINKYLLIFSLIF